MIGICVLCSNNLKKNAAKFCSVQCQQDYGWMLRKKEFESSGLWTGVNSEVVSF